MEAMKMQNEIEVPKSAHPRVRSVKGDTSNKTTRAGRVEDHRACNTVKRAEQTATSVRIRGIRIRPVCSVFAWMELVRCLAESMSFRKGDTTNNNQVLAVVSGAGVRIAYGRH